MFFLIYYKLQQLSLRLCTIHYDGIRFIAESKCVNFDIPSKSQLDEFYSKPDPQVDKLRVVILRNPHGKEASSPHALRQYHNQAQLNLNKYISITSTSETSSCPEAALPAAFEAIMRAARFSNLQMFSTYRRVNLQVGYLATKPHIIKNTTQYGCK